MIESKTKNIIEAFRLIRYSFNLNSRFMGSILRTILIIGILIIAIIVVAVTGILDLIF